MSFGAFNPISGAGLDPSSLIDDGVIELDGDKLSITWAPVNTTPDTSIAQADSVDDLSAILAGIDNALSFLNDTDNPNGFVDKGGIGTSPDSQFSVDDGTRTFTLEPTGSSFNVYMGGFRTTISSTLTVVWANTEGIHHFYVDTDGTLTTGTSFPSNLISELAYVANLYWDATNGATLFLGEERHGIVMDSDSHIYHHQVDGARYQEGFGLTLTADGNGSSNTHAQLAVADGVFRDEDVTHTIADDAPQVMTPIAALPVFYQSGATGTWRKKTADTYPFIQSGAAGYTGANGRAAYNQNNGGTWQLTELGQGGCVLLHVFATNDVNTPIIVILGQAEYASALAARAGAITELQTLVTASLPSQEFVPIGTVILQSSTAYANDVNARFIQTDGGDDYVDWRATTITSGVGTSIPSHSVLSDLDNDDHTQYVLADGTRDITGEIVLQAGAVLGTGDGGATAATGSTLRAPDVAAGGTDVAGADLTIAAGLGTGAGDVGTIIFQTPRVLGSGTTQQSLTTLMTLDEATVTVAGVILNGDGTQAAPAYSFSAGTAVGLYRNGSGAPAIGVNNNQVQAWNQGNTVIAKLLFTEDDIIPGGGADDASLRPSGTIRGADVTGSPTDVAGADITIRPGVGSGAGDVGQIIFQTPRVLGSGSTLQTPTTLMTLDEATVTVTGVIANADGTQAAPAYAFTSNTSAGFYVDATGSPAVAINNNQIMSWSQGKAYCAKEFYVEQDLVVGDGGDAAGLRENGTIRCADVTGSPTDIAGADLTIRPGIGSGAGDVGQIIFQTPRAEASGTTLQTPVTILTLDGPNMQVDGLIVANGNGTDVFQFAADATDPTSGGGAATGRIPVSIGGGTVYLAYY